MSKLVLIILVAMSGCGRCYADDEEDPTIEQTKQVICDYNTRILMAKAQIEHEKKVTKLTGTRNLTALNNAGSTIVSLTSLKEEQLKIFRKLTKNKVRTINCEDYE